jgi:hypothetical protein
MILLVAANAGFGAMTQVQTTQLRFYQIDSTETVDESMVGLLQIIGGLVGVAILNVSGNIPET